MGNSQFNSSKDGEGGPGREGGGFSNYQQTITAAGAPGGFSDASFAPSVPMGDGRRHPYGGVAARDGTARPGAEGPAGDAMDVEAKTDEGEEEEEVRETRMSKHTLRLFVSDHGTMHKLTSLLLSSLVDCSCYAHVQLPSLLATTAVAPIRGEVL